MLKINDNRKKVYVILGRNSSGTSFLSKALYDQGVNMGDDTMMIDPPVYEDEEFLRFNEKILITAGGDWENIPAPKDIEEAFNKHIREATDILSRRLSLDFWGWKDPRNSFTAHLWIRLIRQFNPDLDIYLICVFRDPKMVAGSFPYHTYESSMTLTKAYNESIISIIKEFTNAG